MTHKIENFVKNLHAIKWCTKTKLRNVEQTFVRFCFFEKTSVEQTSSCVCSTKCLPVFVLRNLFLCLLYEITNVEQTFVRLCFFCTCILVPAIVSSSNSPSSATCVSAITIARMRASPSSGSPSCGVGSGVSRE